MSRRKENLKFRAEINEKEMKETIVKINKTKSQFFENINKTEKPGRNGQILRKVQSSKTEPGRNINYEQLQFQCL